MKTLSTIKYSTDEKSSPKIENQVAEEEKVGEAEFSKQMFKTYTGDKRVEKIQEAYDSGDWKNYQILVHALKSTSFSIGAEDLSERAKSLELAAKDNNLDEIRASHYDLMAAY